MKIMIINIEKLLPYCFPSREFIGVIRICLPLPLANPFEAQAQDLHREK
jgi:hypothetical protein